ncbi:tautomerase PptA [Marinobacterium lutimaris]|uniref:4-oxalocrotonate tautomerase n=1 Tax=Marinobacterium lutimaris TaxID=568106 RepID=A0A1H5Y2M7_9GAMM|nr:tautomerase PptA [Marinobacterium lutimaris]SEG18231.1 4-oxalocrotonate tautomerase [Marinobacterium lutimaris]
MPHVEIKYFPRHLSDEEKQAIADDICALLNKHLQASDDSISINLEEVMSGRWKIDVYEPLIKPKWDSLVKKPCYEY